MIAHWLTVRGVTCTWSVPGRWEPYADGTWRYRTTSTVVARKHAGALFLLCAALGSLGCEVRP